MNGNNIIQKIFKKKKFIPINQNKLEKKKDENENSAENFRRKQTRQISRHLKEAIKQCMIIIKNEEDIEKLKNNYQEYLSEEEEKKLLEKKIKLRREVLIDIIKKALKEDIDEEIEQGITTYKKNLTEAKIVSNADIIVRKIIGEPKMVEKLLQEVDNGKYASNYINDKKREEIEYAKKVGEISVQEKLMEEEFQK